MAEILDKADFKEGRYKIVQTEFDKLDSYIDEYEETYLMDLLGVELYALFIADLTDGVPASTIYLNIFNEFAVDNGGCIVKSRGIKTMLQAFIRFHYLRALHLANSANGTVINQTEVSTPADMRYLEQDYNEGIKDYEAIQWYICKHKEDYPKFNGQGKTITHWAL